MPQPRKQTRSAQLGRGDRNRDLSAASASHRAALAHLGERAEAVLRQAGFGATHQVLLRIETTLTAAATGPVPGGPLQGGRGWP